MAHLSFSGIEGGHHMQDSTISSEFKEIAQEMKRFGERCVQASREWLNERRNEMAHRDHEGRRDYPSERGDRDQEQARREFRYPRERSNYQNRPEYSARVQRQAQGYEAAEGEYYGTRQFGERSQAPAWMEENRNWEYEGGPERLGSSGYEQGQQERWNRDLEYGQRSQWAGSQREQGNYASRPGSYYGERPRQATQPDLGYGTRPSTTRAQQNARGPLSSSRGYEPDYGTRSVYGGESAGSGGRGSLYGSDYLDEGETLGPGERWTSSDRYSEPGRSAVSRGYSSMGSTTVGHGYRGVGPKNYRRSDERLTEEINERLTDDDNLDATEITVRVVDGRVTLEGSVDQRWMKHLAEDIADACSGVKEVDNRITVTPGNELMNRSTTTSRTSTTSTPPSGTTGTTGTPGSSATMPH
jgi:hypothetical protein